MRKKKQKNYGGVLLSLFIAFIMITSIMGYIFGNDQTQTQSYKGIKFTLTSTGWRTNYQGNPHTFSYTPKEIEQLNLSFSPNFNNPRQVDLTYAGNSTYGESIAKSIFEFENAASKHNIYVRKGFTTNTSYNYPVITCEDATQFIPVIYYKASNSTSIKNEDNCLIIASDNPNVFVIYTDYLAYKLLGIM